LYALLRLVSHPKQHLQRKLKTKTKELRHVYLVFLFFILLLFLKS